MVECAEVAVFAPQRGGRQEAKIAAEERVARTTSIIVAAVLGVNGLEGRLGHGTLASELVTLRCRQLA